MTGAMYSDGNATSNNTAIAQVVQEDAVTKYLRAQSACLQGASLPGDVVLKMILWLTYKKINQKKSRIACISQLWLFC